MEERKMEVRTVQATLRRLEASEGHQLTSDGKYFCRTVYLGVNDGGGAYREVTDAEAEAALAAIEAERKAAEEAAMAEAGDAPAGDGSSGGADGDSADAPATGGASGE